VTAQRGAGADGVPLRVLVVTPTYDEIDNIARHVRAVLAQPVRPDVLVVDDSSPDGTGAAVRALADERPGRVHLLERPGKEGLGAAYVAGFGWALDRGSWDVVVQMDADGSHEPAAIGDLVAATARADLVLGSRYVPGGRVEDWPARRRALSSFGNLYARTVLGTGLRDLTGGFKAWRRQLLADLGLDTVSAEGYAFQVETTSRAVSLGARVVEVPIVFRDRQLGSSKMRGAIAVEAMGAVWRIRTQSRSGLRPGRPTGDGTDLQGSGSPDPR
jgi:dolichol-phosphate mannosyltransferase